jgi:putative spermidine/putrescine transport system permease protein
MEAEAVGKRRTVGHQLAGLFHGRPRLQIGALLAGPAGWLVVGYLGSLAILLIAGFWTVDPLSGEVVRGFSLENFETLVNEPFYMAKLASRRGKAILVILVLVPLWSSYLVKALSWRTMLSNDGVIDWLLAPFGLSGPGYGNVAVWLVMSYLWLPYMILPIYAGLERIPNSLISASEDLGASPFTTFRRVILPLAFPAVVAGSIFTFALTLGDYITPRLVSNNQFIGNVIFNNISNNLPLASALALVPIVVMVGYLMVARKLGAFEHI